MYVDYLIVGQGLAGSLLGLSLMRAGQRVMIVDAPGPPSASRVAAGIINPVTGFRFTRSWRLERLLPFSLNFYRELEAETKRTVFHPRTICRFFSSPEEELRWRKKEEDVSLSGYFSRPSDDKSLFPGLRLCGNRVDFHPAGYVDTNELLDACEKIFLGEESLRMEEFCYDDLRFIGSDRLLWKDVEAQKVLFCEGYKAKFNPFFQGIPFAPAKGQILTLKAPLFPGERILNRGKWILPVGSGIVKVGATYEWDVQDEEPNEAGREELLRAFTSMVDISAELLDHRAGVRSAVRDTKPLIGLHPGIKTIGIFNGLGSKGVLVAPYFAQHFTEFLLGGAPLDAEVDLCRNL